MFSSLISTLSFRNRACGGALGDLAHVVRQPVHVLDPQVSKSSVLLPLRLSWPAAGSCRTNGWMSSPFAPLLVSTWARGLQTLPPWYGAVGSTMDTLLINHLMVDQPLDVLVLSSFECLIWGFLCCFLFGSWSIIIQLSYTRAWFCVFVMASTIPSLVLCGRVSRLVYIQYVPPWFYFFIYLTAACFATVGMRWRNSPYKADTGMPQVWSPKGQKFSFIRLLRRAKNLLGLC